MNNNKQALVPKLRFPEFRDAGEWASKTLGDACKMQAGKFVSATEIKEQHTSGLFPCFGGNGLRGFTETQTHNGTFPLIGRQGALCGNVKLVTGTFHATEHAVVATPNKSIEVIWLYYLLDLLNLNRFATGQAQPGLSVDVLEKVPVAIPKDDKEQQRIADCLSSLDELIAAHARKVDALKTHKKGLMQQLFPREGESQPRLRFPEFRDAGEWKQVTLGQLMTIKGRIGYRGYTVEDIVEAGEGAISLSPSNISAAGILSFEKATYISWAKFYESPEIILEKNFTVLVKTGSTYGKVAFIRDLPHACTVNPQIVVLKPTSTNPYFLYLLISGESIQSRIEATVVGGAIPTLSQESISKFVVCVPSEAEQQRIADCLTSLDDLISATIQDLETLKTHKKGLMQQLFPRLDEGQK